MKHLEVHQKYTAARRIFNFLLRFYWSGDETLCLILDILLISQQDENVTGAWRTLRSKHGAVTLKRTRMLIACKSRRISGHRVFPPESKVCKPKRPNDFCDEKNLLFSRWAIRSMDRVKLEWLFVTSRAGLSMILESFLNTLWNVNFTTITRFCATLNADFFTSAFTGYMLDLSVARYWTSKTGQEVRCEPFIGAVRVFCKTCSYKCYNLRLLILTV